MNVPSLAEAAAGAVLVWAAALASVEIEAIRRLLMRRALPRALAPALSTRPVVLLIRPCAGGEAWLDRALGSLAGARRSFELRCRIAVESASDGAHPAAARACDSLVARGIDARVVLTAARAPNRKAEQIARVIAAERDPFDVVIVADSDVDLDGADLDALVAPLAGSRKSPEIAAIWAPPVELEIGATIGDRASAAVLGASLHAFPLLAGLDPGGLVGKLFAVRRDALEAVGGFASLTAHLGEDMELARRLIAHGRSVAAASTPARSLSSGRTWDQAAARFGRWITVIRAQRRGLLASYPLLFFGTPLVLALAIVAAPFAPALAAWSAGVALSARVLVALVAARAAGRSLSPVRAIADSFLADALLAVAFVRALRSRRVVWRSTVLTVDRGGRLREA